MRPLTELSKAEARGLQGLLFDLDDTLLDHGQLTLDAYQALCNLAETDLWLVAVTGRPASWGELVAGMWPIRAALSENGHLAHARLGGRVQRKKRGSTRRAPRGGRRSSRRNYRAEPATGRATSR